MHVVIVGAGYAGLACALRLARRTRGAVRITLVNASEQFIERIRLHERAAGRSAPPLDLYAMVRGTGIDLRIGWVDHIDLAARTLRLGDQVVAWDRLVLAAGSAVDTDHVPGVREHAYTLDAASAAWLAPSLPALAAKGGRLLVVGGGLTAIEAATEFAELHPGLRVSMVTRGRLLPGFSSKSRGHARSALARLGVTLHEQVEVRAVEAKQLLHAGTPIMFEACLWAAGFVASPLARQLGLAVNERGQAVVDGALRGVVHPDVFVAGDLAHPDAVLGKVMPMGCKSAFPTGLHVAENVARSLRGEPLQRFSYPSLPFCVSLGRKDALVELPGRDPDRRRVLTGRLAARIKELICRGTLWTFAIERRRASPLLMSSSRTPLLEAERAHG